MKISLAAALLLAGTMALPLKRASADAGGITEQELIRRTQELFDSVVPGDQAPWKKYYADDCLFHDEKGRSLDKPKLIADISPMPKGYTGTIKVTNPQSIITQECAILTYDCDETETIFGQELHARYHQTDTWLQRKGEWQIAASQSMRFYEDPVAAKIDPAKFSAYAGTYKLSKDSERRTTVSFSGDQLFMERTSGKKTQLFLESGDLFFRKGVEGRILFHFGADGKVDRLIDRRNNEDVVWQKIG